MRRLFQSRLQLRGTVCSTMVIFHRPRRIEKSNCVLSLANSSNSFDPPAFLSCLAIDWITFSKVFDGRGGARKE